MGVGNVHVTCSNCRLVYAYACPWTQFYLRDLASVRVYFRAQKNKQASKSSRSDGNKNNDNDNNGDDNNNKSKQQQTTKRQRTVRILWTETAARKQMSNEQIQQLTNRQQKQVP